MARKNNENVAAMLVAVDRYINLGLSHSVLGKRKAKENSENETERERKYISPVLNSYLGIL